MTIAETTSTRPYLIRALYEWCTDNGLTPHLAVRVDGNVQVPVEYVKQGEIVLNISPDATSGLKLGNEVIEFKGRFGGVPREILVPVHQVMAIYARENGQGMSFPIGRLEAYGSTVPSLKDIGGLVDPLPVSGKRIANLASVLPASGQDMVLKSESTSAKKPQGPRPTLKSVK